MRYWIASSALLLATGCTIHQHDRIQELFSVQKGAYLRAKEIHIVEDSRATDAFSLTFQRGRSFATSHGDYPLFFLKADRLPLHERFILARVDPVSGKIDPQCEFEATEEGEIDIFGKDGLSHASEIPFLTSEGFKSGYPVTYMIVSKTGYESASATFTPYPIEIFGEEGERIEAIVTHPMGTHLSIEASGFSPSERLVLIHTSGDLKEEIEITADETGSFSIGLNPTILGKLGGEAKLSVIRLDGQKPLILDYPWGTAIEKKTWQERSLFPMLFIANREIDPKDSDALVALLE